MHDLFRVAGQLALQLGFFLLPGRVVKIGEALAVKKLCRINQGTTLRVREQVNPVAQLKPLKFRVEGQFRDIPLQAYINYGL